MSHLIVQTNSPFCDLRSGHACYQYVNTKFIRKKRQEGFKIYKLIRGRNEPCSLVQLIEAISSIKNIPLEEVVR